MQRSKPWLRGLAAVIGTVLATVAFAAPPAVGPAAADERRTERDAPVDHRTDPRYGLLTPLPDRGGVPPQSLH